VIGRNTQGVKLLDLDEGERVVSVARVEDRIDRNGDAETSGESAEPAGPEDMEPDDLEPREEDSEPEDEPTQ
jgi:DNA gyrase subunit A